MLFHHTLLKEDRSLFRLLAPALLFLGGLAAIGGALFGRLRRRRLILALLGLILWLAMLVLWPRGVQQGAQVHGPPPPLAAETETPLPLSPTPTPQRGRIAFHSERTGDLEIWTMNDDGSNPVQLTNSPGRDFEPAWSPDGRRIVFASGRDDPENSQLYIMNADGSDQHRLFGEVLPYDNWSPRWSRDGQRIYYQSNRDGNFEVYVVNVDGTGDTNLSRHPANDYMPDPSPDGTKVAFVSDRDGDDEIYVMNTDGSNVVRLTTSPGPDLRPRWSPDGAEILFASERSGIPLLYIMPAAGGEARQVGRIDQRVVSPAWAANGQKIIYSGEDGINWDIYIMDRDGRDITRLTDAPGFDRFPDWTP
jgi:Tol biopolymer transport system component